jgi:dihydropteroate synthase
MSQNPSLSGPSLRWLRIGNNKQNAFQHEGLLLSESTSDDLPQWWVKCSPLSQEQGQQLAMQFRTTCHRQALVCQQQDGTYALLLEGQRQALQAFFRQEQALAEPLREWLSPQQDPVASWYIPKPNQPGEQWLLPFRAHRPLIMGIINVTPDSFSDGGRFFDPAQAIAHGIQLVEEGAEILDIGGESTRPGSESVDAKREAERVVPVIEALAAKVDVPISIDTTKAHVADAALRAGATIVNDVSCMRFDPGLADVTARHQAHLILMHSRHKPKDMQQAPHYDDLWQEILAELQTGLDIATKAGIPHHQLAVDPGIGFSKRQQDNHRLLREMRVMQAWGLPILIGASRKSFIGRILGTEASDRLAGSLASVGLAASEGAQFVRVHDVLATKQFIDVWHAAHNSLN